jgi:hypothetical protein
MCIGYPFYVLPPGARCAAATHHAYVPHPQAHHVMMCFNTYFLVMLLPRCSLLEQGHHLPLCFDMP